MQRDRKAVTGTGDRVEDIYRIIAASQAMPTGSFRVVVSEGTARPILHDFETLAEAQAYADDVASEAADEQQLAYVYDSDFVRVYEGRPYYMK